MGWALARTGAGRSVEDSDGSAALGGAPGAAAVSALVSERGRRSAPAWAETVALVVAANFPDVDFLLGVLGAERYVLWHRGLTHSVVGMPVFAAALAVLAHAAVPGLSLSRAAVLCAVGFASHLLLDLPTAWGTIAAYPLSHTRHAWNWLFIIDPILWLILAGGIAAGARRTSRVRRRAARAGVLVAIAYVLLAGALHGAARAETQRAVGAQHGEGVTVFPRPLAPWRWQGVAWRADSLLQVPLAGIPARAGAVSGERHGFTDEAVRRAVRTVPGQAFMWWAQAPVGRVVGRGADRTTVRLSDRRFAGRRGDVFAMEVEIGPGGELLAASWEGEPVFEEERSRAR